jgi:hypothetical protein
MEEVEDVADHHLRFDDKHLKKFIEGDGGALLPAIHASVNTIKGLADISHNVNPVQVKVKKQIFLDLDRRANAILNLNFYLAV